MTRGAVAAVCGFIGAALTFWLMEPDCYTTDGEAGASASGCFTRIGLSTEIGPGLFLLALGCAVLVGVTITAIVWRLLRRGPSNEIRRKTPD